MPAHKCTWAEDGDDSFYTTDCGHAFEVTNGTPLENDFKFCCFCGNEIEQVLHEDNEHGT